jgi:DNA-binding transcriptional ArsR family regulator
VTLRLELCHHGADLVSFGCSPANEALRSLHVLSDVKHHPLHISWTLRARARLSPELRDGVERFAFWYRDRPLVFRDIWPRSGAWSWDTELSALRAAPVHQFAEQLIHGALATRGLGRRVPLAAFQRDADLQHQALDRIGTDHPASLPVLHDLIADPEQCRAGFADFLAAYWQACLAPEWPAMEAGLRDDIARRGRALSRRGLPRMLAELSPHVHPDTDTDTDTDPDTGHVVIRTPDRRGERDPLTVTLAAGDQILLVPSHFVWPELVAVVQRDPRPDGQARQTVLIGYALAGMQREGRPPVPPEHLLKLLRSAGDPTRLQILQLLAQRPRSTREIAGLIGLTEAAISKHLKLLQDAGWVGTERQSYYVYYHLVRESLTDLARTLDQMLG